MRIDLHKQEIFANRHNGPSQKEISEMLQTVGVKSLDELIDQTIPENIRSNKPLISPVSKSEQDYISDLRVTAQKNKVFNSFIGQGYYDCLVPAVIQRNVLENPGWYTAYTPYQAEIAQGRLEALINFQTMVSDLTGMEIANGSLLDEGTAAAEAMGMFYASRKGDKKKIANRFLVNHKVFPQTIDVLKTRAESIGIQLEIVDIDKDQILEPDVFGVYFQYPDGSGEIRNRRGLCEACAEANVFVAVGSDLMALVLNEPPGSWGVDAVVGTSQRFGVPLGYGGPHAAFFATKESFKRAVPGRIIGASKDAEGKDAYRMALQTREQHIKRERATSNICTAQVLLAVISSMYAVYHGPHGLRKIALKIHGLAKSTSDALGKMSIDQLNQNYFDTLRFKSSDPSKLKDLSENAGVNFRFLLDDEVAISFDETHGPEDAELVISIIAKSENAEATSLSSEIEIEEKDLRKVDFLEHPVFNSFHSEHEMLRYIKRLENKDLSLVHSMISLGSCTMKLNATTEMVPVTWPEFGGIHPFAPDSQTMGYAEMIGELHDWLAEITGFHSVSFQPNSGAQGEFAGLMVIRAYHHHRQDFERNVVLIPSSAHGTNPASAVMAGMKVVIVKCDDNGNIDVADLREKVAEIAASLSALMVTYPSTHGVFEESITEICEIIHQNGGQVYMDGANLNAQVGLTSPGLIGADVCHLNLHKTFCIPHGGGGPGMGPIGVAEHLTPFLPGTSEKSIAAISAAPYGSAGILPISHAYVSMMGGEGLMEATRIAILNANYMGKKLEDHYPILYRGSQGRNAHEMIIDCREFKKTGVEVEDIAKRLMDYGYHAPTVSFPVPGTMMIEPTESETKEELDRFIGVMISIREEIREIASGQFDTENNVLKNSPHTYRAVVSDDWDRPYSREKAAFPLPSLRHNKFWPSVARVDNAYGDRNLVCSCLPIEAFIED